MSFNRNSYLIIAPTASENIKYKMSGSVASGNAAPKTVSAYKRSNGELLASTNVKEDDTWELYMEQRDDEDIFIICRDEGGDFNADIYDRVSLCTVNVVHTDDFSNKLLQDGLVFDTFHSVAKEGIISLPYSIIRHDLKKDIDTLVFDNPYYISHFEDLINQTIDISSDNSLIENGVVVNEVLLGNELTISDVTIIEVDGLIRFSIILTPDPIGTTTVVSTSRYNTSYYAHYAVDPSKLLTGSWTFNQWLSGNTISTNQKFSLVLPELIIPLKVIINNSHNSGGNTDTGIKNVIVYGTNSATAFSNTDYADLTDLTEIGSFIVAEHVASNVADPQEFNLTATEEYKYIVLRIADNHGNTLYMSVRHIEFYDSDYYDGTDYSLKIENIYGHFLSESSFRTLGISEIPKAMFALKGVWSDILGNYESYINGLSVQSDHLLFDGTSAVHKLPTCSDTSTGESVGDESNIDILCKFKLNDAPSSDHVLYKSGDDVNGIAIGLTVDSIGLFGSASSVITSITIASSNIYLNTWYYLHCTNTKVTLYNMSGEVVTFAEGTVTAGNGDGQESVGGACAGSPLSGTSGVGEYVNAGISEVVVYQGGTSDYDHPSELRLACEVGETGQQCYVEVEKWDLDNLEVELWVKIPTLPANADTTLRFYFHEDHAPNTEYVGNIGDAVAQNVWDSNYIAVYHMVDESGTIKDSTSNAHHLTLTGGTTVAGLIGNAIDFNGTSDFASSTDAAFEITATGLSYEAVIKRTAQTGSLSAIATKGQAGANLGAFFGIPANSDELQFGTATNYISGGNITTDVLTSIAAVYDGTDNATGLTLYASGIALSATETGTFAGFGASAESFTVGAESDDSVLGNFLDGTLDELRISDIERDADYVSLTEKSNSDQLFTFEAGSLFTSSYYTYTIPSTSSNLLNFPVLLNIDVNSGTENTDSSEIITFAGELDTVTKLLISSDTTDEDTSFVDSSLLEHTITPFGQTHHEVDQAKFGNTSIHFDGAGDYLTVDTHSDFQFGTGDFTIDVWINTTVVTTDPNSRRIISMGPNGDTIINILFDTNGKVVFYTNIARITSSTSVNNGSWHHIALVRETGSTKMYINGINEGSMFTDTNNYTCSTTFYIGHMVGGNGYFDGYMDEFRISKGIARWTENFTPPTVSYVVPSLPKLFAKVDNVSCYLEIEQWDFINKTAKIWCKVPTISENVATVINLYYGDNIDSGYVDYIGITGSLESQNVWDSNSILTYHMNHDLSSGNLIDSTGNNDGILTGFSSNDLVDALIGKGTYFDGTGNKISFSSSNFGTTDFTIQVAFKGDATQVVEYPVLITSEVGATGSGSLFIVDGNSSNLPSFAIGNTRIVAAGFLVTDDIWHTMTIKRESGIFYLYVDGLLVDQHADASSLVDFSTGTIGFADYSPTNTALKSIVDEVRISNIARSSEWISLTHESNTDDLMSIERGYAGGTLSGWESSPFYDLSIDFFLIPSELTNFPVLFNIGNDSGENLFNTSGLFDVLTYANRKKIAVEDIVSGNQCYVEIENWVDAVAETKTSIIVSRDLGSLDDGNGGLNTVVGIPIDNDTYYTFNGDDGLTSEVFLGDNSTEVCYARVRIHNKDKGTPQIIWKDGGLGNGVAAGINASGELGIFGRNNYAEADYIGISSSKYENDVWYDIYFTRTKVSIFDVTTGALIEEAVGNCITTDGTSPESIGYAEGQSPITGASGDIEFFDGDIDTVEIYTEGNLVAPVIASAQLWVKVPTISTSENTLLRLYYDALQSDNAILEQDSYTKLLISSDTTDGDTNFIDSSSSEHTITNVGQTHHEVDQAKFGNTSIHFDGAGDYLTVGDSTDFAFGADDFTIDFWINTTSTERIVFDKNDSGSSIGWWMETHSTNNVLWLGFGLSAGTSHTTFTHSSPILDGEWHHIAVVRSSGSIALYVDGIVVSPDQSLDWSGDHDNSTPLLIGTYNAASHYFDGYMDEFRISKGIARWTENFTPPTVSYVIGYVDDTGGIAASKVWDNNFVAVYHMSQDPSTGGACILDSTSNANHGTPQGTWDGSELVGAGINRALKFNGSNQYIDFGTDTSLDTTAVTLETSYQRHDTGWNNLVSHSSASTANYDLTHGTNILYFQWDNAGWKSQSSTNQIALNTRYTTAITHDGAGTVYFVEDGSISLKGEANTAIQISGSNNAVAGIYQFGSLGYSNITEREVRISNIARSTDWLIVTNLSNTDELLTYSSPDMGGYVQHINPLLGWDVHNGFNATISADDVPSEQTDFPARIKISDNSGLAGENLTRVIKSMRENITFPGTEIANYKFGYDHESLGGFNSANANPVVNHINTSNNALTFDGTGNDSIEIENTFRTVLSSYTLSVTFWVKFDSACEDLRLSIMGTDYYHELTVEIDFTSSYKRLIVRWGYSVSYYDSIVSDGIFEFDKWYHIGITRNYNTKKAYLYVNGELNKSFTMVDRIDPGSSPILIGDSLTYAPFTGSLSDITFWNTDISEDSIRQIIINSDLHTYTGHYSVNIFNSLNTEFPFLLGDLLSSITSTYTLNEQNIAVACTIDHNTYYAYIDAVWVAIASKDDAIHGDTGNSTWHYLNDSSVWIDGYDDPNDSLAMALEYTSNYMSILNLVSLNPTAFDSLFDNTTGVFDIAIGVQSNEQFKIPELNKLAFNDKEYWSSEIYDLDPHDGIIVSSNVQWSYSESDPADYFKVYVIKTGDTTWTECTVNGGIIPGITTGMTTTGMKMQFKVEFDLSIDPDPSGIRLEFKIV